MSENENRKKRSDYRRQGAMESAALSVPALAGRTVTFHMGVPWKGQHGSKAPVVEKPAEILLQGRCLRIIAALPPERR